MHVMQRFPTIHGHVIIIIVVLAMLATILTGVALQFDQRPAVSDNTVDSTLTAYEKQLPALAAKAERYPKDAEVRQDYAMALHATGDLRQAQSQYEAAVRLKPDDSAMHNNLGSVYRDQGDYGHAVDAYKTAVRLNAKNANAYTNLANMYLYTLNQKELGVQTYETAVAALPEDQGLLTLLGVAYEQVSDYASAKASYAKALALDADNKAAIAGLKRLH
jgi:Flp pilus assembly protein TadD